MKKIIFFLIIVCGFYSGGVFAATGKIITDQNGVSFEVKTVKIKKGDSYYKLFKKNWRLVRALNKIDEKNLRIGLEIIFPASDNDWEKAKKWAPLPKNYQPFKNRQKAILVDLKSQYFGAYERGKLKFFGPISSGSEKCFKIIKKNGEEIEVESNCETPAGFFRSMARHENHVSSEYQDAEGNGVPMPYAVMFTIQKDPDKNIKTAFWIHGGALPGYPASHGCVRVLVEDAKKVFYFVGFKNKPNEEKEDIEWFPPKKSILIAIVPAK